MRLDAALAAQRDSASQWQEARHALTLRLAALWRDSSRLASQYASASRAAAVARHRADSLLWYIPDTLRIAVRLVFDSLAAATVACENLRQNCELRAQNAEARVRGDSTQLVRLMALTDTLEVAWKRAERQAQ